MTFLPETHLKPVLSHHMSTISVLNCGLIVHIVCVVVDNEIIILWWFPELLVLKTILVWLFKYSVTIKLWWNLLQSLESRLKPIDEAVSHLPNFSKFESDAVKVGRDITSARADMKRLEGRMIQSTEDFASTKTEVTKLGKHYWTQIIHISKIYSVVFDGRFIYTRTQRVVWCNSKEHFCTPEGCTSKHWR